MKLSKHDFLTHTEKINAKTVELKAREEYCKYKTLHLEDTSKAEKDYIKALENMRSNCWEKKLTIKIFIIVIM